ncbi:hypothetical protein NLJ89_g1316 [Agrocybe chaxingu]|uniref:DNA polymerase eta n=1 Tax=Agrocybe chaxingu TaxID=84603 RepID=A0A9W8N0A4_9AGAR|nr:hypothetical protein NLJ89_g1316 [Agrocybe chaxingu]
MALESPRKGLWKGKGKASEPMGDFDESDLNPVITYRHILSNNLGVRDPLRVIALCDSDAFYAACEMVRLGVDPETPLVVLQWDMLIAVNYPARKYGISRMDKKKDALKKCPHVKIVHVATYKEGEKEPGYWDDVDTKTHKVSLDHYRRESLKIAALFKELLPGVEIEKASIDEAFFDYTRSIKEVLLQRYPYLAEVPPSGADTPLPPPPPIAWDGLGNLIPINPPPAEEKAPDGANEAAVEREPSTTVQEKKQGAESRPEDPPATWHDVALSIAAELMAKAKEEVRVKLGYTTSAGISRNKFLAKLAASYKKFNTHVRPIELWTSIIPTVRVEHSEKFGHTKFPATVKFSKGGKLGEAIAREYDASTVEDLLTISIDEMQSKFGEESIWVYEILRGIDRSEVKDKGSTLNKSMLAAKNLPKPITKASEGQHWIRVLAAELALRLNDARRISPHLWPKTLVLHARRGHDSRSKQTPFLFTRELTVDTIASAGNKLWKELVGNNTTLKVTSVSLGFTNIDVAETGQQTIEGFLKPPSSTKKRMREPEIDLNSRVRDSLEIDGNDPCPPDGGKETPDDTTAVQALSKSYTCPRCGKTFQIPAVDRDNEDEGSEDQLLAKVQGEHEDFHFAQDLANEGKPHSIITASQRAEAATASKPRKKQKPPPEPRGIEKFFRK